MPRNLFIFCLLLIANCISGSEDSEFCVKPDGVEVESKKCLATSNFSKKRYILYDVNPPEGFNLRRDVYVRVAVFVKKLLEENGEFDWNLVLPPWGNLYHWRSKNIGSQVGLPWGLFFDVSSLRKYIPVLEMYDFMKEYPSIGGEISLDIVYVLQNDEEMFKTGKFKDKNEIADCAKGKVRYEKIGKNKFTGNFWGYLNITARDVKCLTFQGTTSGLTKNLQPIFRSVVFDHMEIALHDFYGSKDYWTARRSMRYNQELYEIANEFRKNKLNSADLSDKTERPTDWKKEKGRRSALGGSYLALHLRRRDFLIGRSESVPTIENAALQLKKKLEELKLKTIFVATDAENEEYEELKKYLEDYIITKFIPSEYVRNKFKDGGIAIIDQIICSYARYFIGTHESTFTFRIQEDREIIGFPSNTTFNRLCGKEKKCSQGGKWEIVW
ncbi:GDP-fucose protein O-fucosyltransferase 2 [Belonocnema kinseyi]|uniref:GDP-fucose protein O-fucosyltransferase 2 n=1 Tax=Belonocnema kinseyi TaxID=2817044 RepID=UPI00143DF2A8|nr:GDP-fucose protein O-fucosyltransferase 2 [Belonocnema kinseyi]